MAATNSTQSFCAEFALMCLGIVFVGGWYFQSLLAELRIEMAVTQQDILKQMTKMMEDNTNHQIKIEVQAETIQQLKEITTSQNKQLNQLQFQSSVSG